MSAASSIPISISGEIWALPELIQATKEGIEIWRSVLGADGKYDVSNFGQVRNTKHGFCLIQGSIKSGYKVVGLYLGDGKRRCATVQFLMAEAFIGPRPGTQYEWEAAHHDGTKANNRLDNIAWKTRKANQNDRRRHGTMPSRETKIVNGVKNYRCTACETWKPEPEFRELNIDTSTCKRQSTCLECSKARDREYRRKVRQKRAA